MRTDKPWGYEELIEVNDSYAIKRIFMKAGHKCSLQKHLKKRETFVLLSGTMKYTHPTGVDIVINQNADVPIYAAYTIQPGEVHRMEAITDILYLECSTPELDDVERLDDDYDRL